MTRIAIIAAVLGLAAAACGGVETDGTGVIASAVVAPSTEAAAAPSTELAVVAAPATAGTNPIAASQDPMPVMPNVAQPACQPGRTCGDGK